MTAEWRETTPCLRCGTAVDTEQPVKAWIRKHEGLDSREQCLCIGDSDLWVQRYGVRRGNRGADRDVMYLMLVEVKTNGAKVNAAQRDMLVIVNDLLRTVAWKDHRADGKFELGHRQNARLVYSVIAGKKIQLLCYGVHRLTLPGATPDDSDWFQWDFNTLPIGELEKILRFDVNPDSLKPMEHRSHKRQQDAAPVKQDMPALFTLADLVA